MRSAAEPRERAAAQAFSSSSPRAALADRLDDGILGREEAVDICRRHPKLTGNIGDRRLAEAEAAEQSLGRVHDAYAGVIGLGLDLGAHGSTDDDWMTSDENDNSSVRNVKGDLSSRRGPVKGVSPWSGGSAATGPAGPSGSAGRRCPGRRESDLCAAVRSVAPRIGASRQMSADCPTPIRASDRDRSSSCPREPGRILPAGPSIALESDEPETMGGQINLDLGQSQSGAPGRGTADHGTQLVL